MGLRFVPAFLLGAALLYGANPTAGLLNAAAQGRTREVEEFIGKGASVDARDKAGRTPLMLAAQRGHPDTVAALLKKGADAKAKDRNGATAWYLAMFDPVGSRLRNQDVLDLLAAPPRPKIAMEAAWSESNLYSSCSVPLETLTRNVAEMQPDLLMLAAFVRQAEHSGHDLVTVASSNGRGNESVPRSAGFAGADAIVALTVRPAASCAAQQPGDQLGLTIDVQVLRAADRSVMLHKVFGGGLKGLRARTVTGPAQYFPVYQELMKPHVEGMYQAVVEAWYRGQ